MNPEININDFSRDPWGELWYKGVPYGAILEMSEEPGGEYHQAIVDFVDCNRDRLSHVLAPADFPYGDR